MVNQPPESWTYNNSLEMLFLFYQRAEELLSEVTSDTYSLPMHNCMTLLYEMDEVYSSLESHDALDPYYMQYIPPIIEEFLEETETDYLLKQLIGVRLASIRTGFREALGSSAHLKSWIASIYQICGMPQYIEEYRNEIVRLVSATTDKNKLLYCIQNYFVSLRWLGYSREYLYVSTKKFFDNRSRTINDLLQIKEFLSLFPCKRKRYDFLILMNIDSLEYMDSISDNLTLSKQIKKVTAETVKKKCPQDDVIVKLLNDYDFRMNHKGEHEKVAIVEFFYDDYDPYNAAKIFTDYISFIQTFARYFKHFHFTRQVYRILLKDDYGHYREITIPRDLQKRPHIDQKMIDLRIGNIMTAKSLGPSAFDSITQAIVMHAEAFESKSASTRIKSFWTALETLFSDPTPNHTRENVINSTIQIIQKTYILKKMRALYSQLKNAVSSNDLSNLGITNFKSFVEYFATHSENDDEMKKLYQLLSINPLLRSRIFSARTEVATGAKIRQLLEQHQQRIEWQLKRIYRIRNISTHLGETVMETEVAVNHVHNYFDFMVNYLLCKSENGNNVVSISAVVFEAKNDNRIYNEILKENACLGKDNYMMYLFGPDKNLINYQFEY